MSNQFLQSAQYGFMIDIATPVASGSPLQVLLPKLERNQYWTTEDVPGKPGYFWIVSGARDSAGQNLVIDIKDPVNSGSTLQALVKRNENNQYWTTEDVPGKPGYFWIVSGAKDSAGQNLVIDIEDPGGSGATLQALIKKNENNQYWTWVAAQPATTPNNFGSGANYIFYCPSSQDQCNSLTALSVTITITEDLVAAPPPRNPPKNHTQPGFAFQLNASSPINKKNPTDPDWIVWQQYIIGVGEHIVLAVNNWTAASLPAQQTINSPPAPPLATPPKPYMIPAGTTLSMNLEVDKDNNVSVVALYIQGPWVPVSSPPSPVGQTIYLKSIPLAGGGLVTSAYLAPIVAFELNLVGPGDLQYANFTSGAGRIDYYALPSLTPLNYLPSCVANGTTTGQRSNSTYGTVPAVTSTLFQQSFSFRS